MSRAWMPMYWGDYKSDTAHLSTLEHGAYMLLIAHYWQTGSLPKDDERLARVAGLDTETWLCVRIAVASFFTSDWKHKRIEIELKKADEKSVKASKSAANRWNKDKKPIMRTHSEGICERNAKAMLSQSQSQSELSSNEDNKTREARSLAVQAAFDAFWRRWPHKVGKPAAEKAFAKVSGEIEAILLGIDRYIRDKPPDRPWLNPATFLNQRRWEDAPAETFAAIRQEPQRKISAITQAIMNLEAEINETQIPRDSPSIRQIPVNGEPVSRGFGFEDTQLPGDVKRFHG